ncbi:DUF4898 domain-containing protein [Sulfurisphaera javensis]|uniref:DUF4898 domain-containing protein n=1 Tax=Sulfurisphaera javensis TaxID=2049879 RepID=A0AAT9GSJ2_9CREN
MINLADYVEENIKDMVKTLGCSECYLYKFNLVSDYSKFFEFIISSKKIVTLVISSGRSDREVIMENSNKIAKSKNVPLHIFLSDRIDENSFIICYRKS